FASADVVERTLAADARDVCIAAHNEPRHVVISGSTDGVARVRQRLEQAGHLVKQLRVSGGVHSPQMDPILTPFGAAIAPAAFRAPARMWLSQVTGREVSAAPDASYWVRQIREPVRFCSAVQAAVTAGASIFLEIGPARTLVHLARQSLSDESLCIVPSLIP